MGTQGAKQDGRCLTRGEGDTDARWCNAARPPHRRPARDAKIKERGLELTWCAVPSAVLASRSPSAPRPPCLATGRRASRRTGGDAGLSRTVSRSPLSTSHLATSAHKQIPNNGHASSPTVSWIAQRAARQTRRVAWSLLTVADTKSLRNFTVMFCTESTCSQLTENTTTVMASSSSPQELTREGHHEVNHAESETKAGIYLLKTTR